MYRYVLLHLTLLYETHDSSAFCNLGCKSTVPLPQSANNSAGFTVLGSPGYSLVTHPNQSVKPMRQTLLMITEGWAKVLMVY